MDAKARSKMTLSTMTEQDRKMELGVGLEHMGWDNRALHKLHIKESISSERSLRI